MSDWLVLCSQDDRETLAELVSSLDDKGRAIMANGADDLRSTIALGEPGEYGALIGQLGGGVTDVNLAAAVANDGNARSVVLARRAPSGSLRSRAARAGVDLVVDLADLASGRGSGRGRCESDGGRPVAVPDPPGLEMEDAAPLAPVIVLCSGRGGVGKTTLAAALAVTAARWGMKVCLVDLDLSCGNAYACFGMSGGTDLATLDGVEHGSPERLSRLCRTAAPGVGLMGPCGRPENAELAMPHVGEVLDYASREFDLVIVDTSTTFTDAVAHVAQRADRLVIVFDGRPGAVPSLARMAGLAVRLGVARTRIVRLENRADSRERQNQALARAEVGLEAARAYRILEGGHEIQDLLAAGQVSDLAGSGHPFAESVASVLAQILAELGRLPDCDEAERAREGDGSRRWFGLFARREARRA